MCQRGRAMEDKMILFADKSEGARKKATSFLKKHGFAVVAAKDGMEALQKTMTVAPDALVVNAHLPIVNGPYLLQFMRQDPLLKDIPVMILSEKDELENSDIIECDTGSVFTGSTSSADFLSAIKAMTVRRKPSRKREEKKMTGSQSTAYLLERSFDYFNVRCDRENTFDSIRKIGLKGLDYEKTVESVLSALSKIIGFDSLAFFINDSTRSTMIVKCTRPVKEDYIDRLKFVILERLARKGVHFDAGQLDIKEFKSSSEGAPVSSENLLFIGDPVLIDEQIRGFTGITVSSQKEKKQMEEQSGYIRTLLHHAFVVIETSHLRDNYMRLSTTDSLTGIHNRHRIIETLKKELVRAKRYFLDLSLVLFDIDNFKTINDFYGYQVGDVILRDLASVTAETMRSIDEVGRYGGEEFLVILPETNLKNASIAGSRIKNRVMNHVFPGIAKDIKISLSIGITSYLRDVDISVDDLLRRTDQSLYEAKKKGKNCVYVMSK